MSKELVIPKQFFYLQGYPLDIMYDVEAILPFYPFFLLSLTTNRLFNIGFEMEQD